MTVLDRSPQILAPTVSFAGRAAHTCDMTTKKPLSEAQARRQDARDTQGRYAETTRAESLTVALEGIGVEADEDTVREITLSDEYEDVLRHVALIEEGYTPAATLSSLTRPDSTEGIDEWWGASFLAGGTDESGLPRMDDAWRPSKWSRHGGNALSGDRRVHRMSYKTDGLTVRMPSKTMIRRFASEQDSTFAIKVEYADRGGAARMTEVKVQRLKNGMFRCETIGEDADTPTGARIGELVTATLEGSRPPLDFGRSGSLTEDARRRALAARAAAGSQMVAVKSSWVAGVVPLPTQNAVGIVTKQSTRQGRSTYVRPANAHDFQRLVGADAPGKVANPMLRGRHDLGQIEQCAECGRYKAQASTHVCPHKMTAAPVADGVKSANVAQAAAARAEARAEIAKIVSSVTRGVRAATGGPSAGGGRRRVVRRRTTPADPSLGA